MGHEREIALNPIATILADQIARWLIPGTALIVGVCGTQASGKSTACAQLEAHFSAKGLRVGTLSLDDLYLSRTARAALATATHPLFETRGPPGTHDCAAGITVFEAVKRGEAVRLPRFDKRADAPMPEDSWPLLEGSCDLLLFEGWCVGARPQSLEALADPVNGLEAEEDEGAAWRGAINAHLAEETGRLFALIDRLIYLRPPSFDVVATWRWQQEQGYIARDGPERAAAAMTQVQLARFIAHYQRMTCEMMAAMPSWADVTLQLDAQRVPIAVSALA